MIAVLASNTFGIAKRYQSLAAEALTMYALLSAVNNIAMEASATHIPIR